MSELLFSELEGEGYVIMVSVVVSWWVGWMEVKKERWNGGVFFVTVMWLRNEEEDWMCKEEKLWVFTAWC